MPKISVVIACYNRKEMLAECIDSFLKSTFKDFEIIVADNGSTEDLKSVCDSFKDKRVRYKYTKKRGISVGNNLGAKHARGEYIMSFGSDDLALPQTLAILYDYAEKHPEYDAIYCDYFVTDSNKHKAQAINEQYNNTEEDYKLLLERQTIPHGGTLWKLETYPVYDETLESAVDWELMLTAVESGLKFHKIENEPLWIYRMGHPREEQTERQILCMDRTLRRRGYRYDRKLRRGVPSR